MTSSPPESSSAHPGRFQKTSRLLKHADFDRVYRQGKRHFSQNMTVFWAKRGEQQSSDRRRAAALRPRSGQAPGATQTYRGPRVGLTVGKVLGGAVVRNRIKRRMREAVRMSLAGLKMPVDVVINPKKSALTAEMPKLQQEVGAAFAVIEKQNPTQRTQGTQRESGI